MPTETFDFPSADSAIAFAGYREANLKLLARQTGAKAVLRGQTLTLSGTDTQVARSAHIVRSLAPSWSRGRRIDSADILTACQAWDANRQDDLAAMQSDPIARTRRGEDIYAKTFHQWQYVRAIRSHDLTFCAGPAGTGKTYLAAVMAAQALLDGECERIVLTRPAVEAGERLGFLPGDLQQKVDPYLRPLYDALYEIVDPEKVQNLMERGIVEVAPLAYMRGRTLSNAFAILDEAQNTTPGQMKMMLTRLGWRSRMVVTGDLTQTDLTESRDSGLSVAHKILRSVEGVAFCKLTAADVVRHPLVQRIVSAYETYEGGRT